MSGLESVHIDSNVGIKAKAETEEVDVKDLFGGLGTGHHGHDQGIAEGHPLRSR